MLRFWYSDRSSATFLLTHPIPRAAKYLSPLSRSFFISSHSPNKLCRIVVSRGFVTVPAIIFAWGMSPHLAIFVWYNFPWWRHFGAQVMGALNQSINSDVFIRIWLTIILLINLYVCFSGNILLFFFIHLPSLWWKRWDSFGILSRGFTFTRWEMCAVGFNKIL